MRQSVGQNDLNFLLVLCYLFGLSQSYRLFKSHGDTTPFGTVAKNLLKSVLGIKHKEQRERWEDVVEQAKVLNKKGSRIFEKNGDSDESLDDPMKFRSIAKSYEREKGGEMMELSRKLSELEEVDEHDPRARQLLRDIVDGQKERPKVMTPQEKVANLLKDGLKLGYSLAGQNTSDFDEKSLRIASPRFLSLMPEQESKNEIELASPSLLSLHNQGHGIENLTSLPNLLNGINEQDRQAWLDLVVEASGVTDQLKDLAENLDQRNGGPFEDGFEGYRKRGKREDGMPLYFTKENVTKIYGEKGQSNLEHWNGLNKMFTKEQLKEMNSTGFAILTKPQQQYMYGDSSPYSNRDALQRFQNLSKADVYDELDRDVKALSRPGARLDSRLQDIILAPVSFTWVVGTLNVASSTILSPVSFSPSILSPVIFGPMIISPWIFSPLILSPKLMSPLILAPYIFSPIILSPLVLHPQILSPGVFTPHILVPFLLSPLILTPQVFCPLILSPLVMAPVIANPAVGSPKVLSPFVLSPSLYSPQALSGLVLSPYALSPLFFSKVYFFRLILSPSWLS
uniref:Uncharacterized protein n=1 Tax=Bursaphelenchus xylophilus TaxID=6326 RepID=A0A1I7SDZ7_BURXY